MISGREVMNAVTNITLVVSDHDGKPFHLFRQTERALKNTGYERSFRREALSGDYDRMLRTIIKYVRLTKEPNLPLDP